MLNEGRTGNTQLVYGSYKKESNPKDKNRFWEDKQLYATTSRSLSHYFRRSLQALLPGGTCPLRCHKSWAAPSSPDRVPGAGRERWTPGRARSHGQAGPLFFSCAITRGKGVKNNDLAGAGGGRFKSSAWRWRARVSAGRAAAIEGKGRGKIPFCRKCCWGCWQKGLSRCY